MECGHLCQKRGCRDILPNGEEPTEDKNLYTYPTEPTEDNILSGGLEQNGGTYNGGVATEVEFNQTEGALTLNNDGVEDAGLYDYFNYNIGGAITKGQIDLGFKFKTNGAYFGIITRAAETERAIQRPHSR